MSTSLAVDPMTMAYHELRSPLGLVAMTARVAAGDCTDAQLRRRCEAIERAAQRLLRTTENVLALATAGVDTVAETFGPVDELSGMVADFRALGMPLNLIVEPRAYGSRAIMARAGFEALVQSLICNALDHGVNGGVIEIRADASPHELFIDISNEAALETRHAGLGVGMYMCKRLAETLGVEVSSHRDLARHTVAITIRTTQPRTDG